MRAGRSFATIVSLVGQGASRETNSVARLRALIDPTRLAVYRFVAAHREPVTRAQAARALGLGLPIASFHLERLLRDGFVEVVAGGPEPAGPGRPAKRYRASSAELALAIPPRNYGLAAAIVIEAVRPSWRSVRGRVARLARRRGREIADILRRRLVGRPTARTLRAALLRSLGELGYEPRVDRAVVRLTNCPFHALAAVDRAAVCEMNHELLSGVVAGLPECALRASLEPDVGCCVVIRKRRPARRLTIPGLSA